MDGDGVADVAIGARYGGDRRGVLHIVSGARLLDRVVLMQRLILMVTALAKSSSAHRDPTAIQQLPVQSMSSKGGKFAKR